MTISLPPLKIAVAICTFNRNEALTTLLKALLVSILRVAGQAMIGVVIVDDSSDGKAQSVADRFRDRFELGLAYRHSGKQNISLARNLAVETGSLMADWVAMIDDDCEPFPEWLEELIEAQRRTHADAITGPMKRRVPVGSPRWLTDEPFLDLGHPQLEDGAELAMAATFNSMISSTWLKNHPEVRFDPALGTVGGEDMVFYRTANAKGLCIRYAARAGVYENEPPARANLPYQLRLFFWHGNSSYVTSVNSGVRPFRVFVHGANSMQKAFARPIIRIAQGQQPQLRYCLALVLHALGKMIGPFGIRIRHK